MVSKEFGSDFIRCRSVCGTVHICRRMSCEYGRVMRFNGMLGNTEVRVGSVQD